MSDSPTDTPKLSQTEQNGPAPVTAADIAAAIGNKCMRDGNPLSAEALNAEMAHAVGLMKAIDAMKDDPKTQAAMQQQLARAVDGINNLKADQVPADPAQLRPLGVPNCTGLKAVTGVGQDL